MPVFHWSCSSVHDLMRQCLPELADTILQAWEAYQCSRRGTYLPFLLSGKEVSERKRQQRLIKTLQIYSFLPPPVKFIFGSFSMRFAKSCSGLPVTRKFFSSFFRPENLFVVKISKFCIKDMEIYPNFVRKIREASYADQEDMVRGKQNICSVR